MAVRPGAVPTIAALLLGCSLSGCATVADFTVPGAVRGPWLKSPSVGAILAGTLIDARNVVEGPRGAVLLIDQPFRLALDLAAAPLTIPLELAWRALHQETRVVELPPAPAEEPGR